MVVPKNTPTLHTYVYIMLHYKPCLPTNKNNGEVRDVSLGIGNFSVHNNDDPRFQRTFKVLFCWGSNSLRVVLEIQKDVLDLVDIKSTDVIYDSSYVFRDTSVFRRT